VSVTNLSGHFLCEKKYTFSFFFSILVSKVVCIYLWQVRAAITQQSCLTLRLFSWNGVGITLFFEILAVSWLLP